MWLMNSPPLHVVCVYSCVEVCVHDYCLGMCIVCVDDMYVKSVHVVYTASVFDYLVTSGGFLKDHVWVSQEVLP